jgi:hypothetical protein
MAAADVDGDGRDDLLLYRDHRLQFGEIRVFSDPAGGAGIGLLARLELRRASTDPIAPIPARGRA